MHERLVIDLYALLGYRWISSHTGSRPGHAEVFFSGDIPTFCDPASLLGLAYSSPPHFPF
jgi:hypothetical protein